MKEKSLGFLASRFGTLGLDDMPDEASGYLICYWA